MSTITKDIRLNADKRKSIVNVYENFLLTQSNKARKTYDEAKAKFDDMYPKIWELVKQVVRKHQPQKDVDTVKSMIDKYGDNGGRIHEDSCFYFTNPSIEKDNDSGREYERDNEVHVDMTLDANPSGHHGNDFAYAYYYDELKAKGLDPDFKLRWSDERRNPRYYETESKVREYLGFSRRNNDDRTTTPVNEWKQTIPVIGTSYCHSRQFKVDDITHSVFKEFVIAQSKVCQAHESMFNYVNDKVSKLEQGLKTYTKFSQAKQLFDKLGIPLNESAIDEQSSMALSVFSPDNLAEMLTDSEEQFSSREEKIAYFRSLQAQAN